MLKSLKNPVIIGHTHADPDAVGAAYVLSNYFNTIPSFDGSVSKEGRSLLKFLETEYDLNPTVKNRDVILVDVSSRDMIPNIPIEEAKKIVIIDHHPTKDLNGTYIGGPQFSSSCEIVYRLLKGEKEFNVKERIALASGIIYDTVNLLKAKGTTLNILSELLGDKRVEDALPFKEDEPLSQRIAHLKAMKRSSIWSVGDVVIVVSRVGSFEGSTATALITAGADVSIVYSKRLLSARLSRRASSYISLLEVIPKGCGGHREAIGCKNVDTARVARIMLRRILRLLSERTGNFDIRRY